MRYRSPGLPASLETAFSGAAAGARFILFILFLLPPLLFSQTVSEKENQFIRLVDLGESAPAHALLADLLEDDSMGVYRLADAAERLILPGAEKEGLPVREEIAQLIKVYELGVRHDPAGPGAWQVRKALLALRYPGVFAGETLAVLREAVRSAPVECPLLLYEHWAETEIEAWNTGKKTPASRNAVTTAWQEISDLLYLRQVRHTAEAEASGRLFQRLALLMRDNLPDCADLAKIFNRPPDDAAAKDFLILSALQGCDPDPALWSSAFEVATRQDAAAWMYRLSAARTLDARDYQEALQEWEKAANLENDPARKAADQLRIADILALTSQYALARTRINQAIGMWPAWGQPYFQLCDLYLESAGTCKFSDFDRKAIYWLAIDLCQTAQNADPGCTAEATERIYRYKKLAPTAAETAFKGLKSGDSWPLRCWMSTVTTVKVD